MNILAEIQTDLLKQEVPLSTILRKAKVLASQLRSEELSNWVSRELDGYKSNDELPDYRVIRTGCFGKWTNNYYVINQRGVPLNKITDERLKDFLTTFNVNDGVRSIEQLAADPDKHFVLGSDIVSWVNHYVAEQGYGYMEIEFAVGPHEFEQILDTGRNRLLDFVLKLDENWPIEDKRPSKDELNKLVSVIIYNNPGGGDMSVFDQRGQQVQYQYNAAGNINFADIHDKNELADEMEKLKRELEYAKQSNTIDEDVAVEAEYHLLQATKEARKESPAKVSFLEHVTKAQGILQNVAAVGGLVNALVKAAEIAGLIFS